MSTSFRLQELAEKVGGRAVGDSRRMIRGVETLDRAGPEHLSFLTNPRYRKLASGSGAGALLVAPGSEIADRDLLESAEPYLALARILELFHPAPPRVAVISDDARIGEDVSLGEAVSVGSFAVVEDGAALADRVTIGPGCVVGRGSTVGEDTELKPRVVLYPGTRVGKRCLIHSGVVLGGDGFGFATSSGKHHKIPQLGRVEIEDDVEIGCNTTIDRGALGATVVASGSKLDNLVMVAHGVRIGSDALLAAQTGIAGSTRIGDRATFAGQSGAAGHLEIGAGAVVAAKTAVLSDLGPGEFVAGIPAVDHRRWKRSQAVVRKLPELQQRLRDLGERMEAIERKLDRSGPRED